MSSNRAADALRREAANYHGDAIELQTGADKLQKSLDDGTLTNGVKNPREETANAQREINAARDLSEAKELRAESCELRAGAIESRERGMNDEAAKKEDEAKENDQRANQIESQHQEYDYHQ